MFTVSKPSDDLLSRCVSIDKVTNIDSSKPEFKPPTQDMLDRLIPDITRSNYAWVYHQDHLVWYAVSKQEYISISQVNNDTCTIRYFSANILTDLPCNVSGIYESVSTGWAGDHASIELFIEKLPDSDNIQGPGGMSATPIRKNPPDNQSIYVFDYCNSDLCFISMHELIGVKFRDLAGNIVWKTMTAEAAYNLGCTSNKLTERVNYTGRVALITQTNVWKIARNQMIWNIGHFLAIPNQPVPPSKIEDYVLPADHYWVQHKDEQVFYEVDREPYIRIIQLNQISKSTVIQNNTRCLVNRSNPFNPTEISYSQDEILWNRTTNKCPTMNYSFPYYGDSKPYNVQNYSQNSLPCFSNKFTYDQLLFVLNVKHKKWHIIVKDQVCMCIIDGVLKVCTTNEIVLGEYINKLLFNEIQILEQINKANTMIAQSNQDVPQYRDLVQKARDAVQSFLAILIDYTSNIQNTINYYNITSFISMHNQIIIDTAINSDSWVLIGAEIVQDIEQQCNLMRALSTSDPNDISNQVYINYTQISINVGQINTQLAQVQQALSLAKCLQDRSVSYIVVAPKKFTDTMSFIRHTVIKAQSIQKRSEVAQNIAKMTLSTLNSPVLPIMMSISAEVNNFYNQITELSILAMHATRSMEDILKKSAINSQSPTSLFAKLLSITLYPITVILSLFFICMSFILAPFTFIYVIISDLFCRVGNFFTWVFIRK